MSEKWMIYKFICENKGRMVKSLSSQVNPILQGLGLLIGYIDYTQLLDLLDVAWVRYSLQKIIDELTQEKPPDLGVSVSEEISANDRMG